MKIAPSVLPPLLKRRNLKVSPFFVAGGGLMSSTIPTFPPLCPLPLTKGGAFYPLHKKDNDFKVFKELVRDFDERFYLRGKINRFFLFFCA